MQEFLSRSAVVNFEDPAVKALSSELLMSGAREGYAKRCFEWVRDQVAHSADTVSDLVTCSASEVLASRVGLCYAKCHLLVALLRCGQVAAGFSYQRLATDDGRFCLHGIVAVFVEDFGWYRVDPRGGPRGKSARFSPPVESLVYIPKEPGEMDLPGVFAEPLPTVVSALRKHSSARTLLVDLPDQVWRNRSLQPMSRPTR